MARYIDAGKAYNDIETLDWSYDMQGENYNLGLAEGLNNALQTLDAQPTADVEPVRHGK